VTCAAGTFSTAGSYTSACDGACAATGANVCGAGATSPTGSPADDTILSGSMSVGGVTQVNQPALTAAITIIINVPTNKIKIKFVALHHRFARGLSGDTVVEFTVQGRAAAMDALAATLAAMLEAPAFSAAYVAAGGGTALTVSNVVAATAPMPTAPLCGGDCPTSGTRGCYK
jgi:hypothetical protein